MAKAIAAPESLFLAIESAPGAAQPTMITVKGQKLARTFGIDAELGKLYLENAGAGSGIEIVHAPFLIWLGGIDVYRTDLKRSAAGQDIYFALLAVGIKNRVLVFQVRGESQTAIDDGVRMLLRAVLFTPAWSVSEDQIDRSPTRVKISSQAADTRATRKVPPVYPRDAKAAHIQGLVILAASISSRGDVQQLWVLEGDPLLAQAAVDAVRQWKYQQYMLKGTPAIVETKVIVNFRLEHR